MRDTRPGREVAVKVPPSDLAAEGGRLKRFGREARAASSSSHPNIFTEPSEPKAGRSRDNLPERFRIRSRFVPDLFRCGQEPRVSDIRSVEVPKGGTSAL